MIKHKKLLGICIFVVLVVAAIIIIAQVNKKEPIPYTYNPHITSTNLKNQYDDYLEEVTETPTYPNSTTRIDVVNNLILDPNLTTATYQTLERDSTLPLKEGSLVENYTNLESGLITPLLYVDDYGQVSWKVNVPQSGFYNLKISYYTTQYESTRSSIEKKLNIVTSSDEINTIYEQKMASESYVFSRNWGAVDDHTKVVEESNNKSHVILDVKQDLNNNDIKPSQIEIPTFRTSYFYDDMGYETSPYKYYFTEGENVVSLIGIKGTMLIEYLEITAITENITYSEYKEATANKAHNVEADFVCRIEGETANASSSPTLYPTTDRTSSMTYPHSASATKFNCIGGDSWKVLGDWLTWDIDVPADGYYNISLRARQNLVRGMYSNRIVSIDGEILFEELNQTIFSYSSNWQIITLGLEDENFDIYLTKGKHTLTMEVTLGDYGELVEELENIIGDLNSLYLEIIKFTTTSPDANRDYVLESRPNLFLIDRLTNAKDRLVKVSDAIAEISGTKSDKTGVIDSVVVQLEDFIKRPRTIPGRLSSFNTNVSSLGTLLTTLREFPLAIDYIEIYGATSKGSNHELSKANEGFFRKIWDSVVGFIYSFIVDYSAVGETVENVSDGNKEIDVWMTLGRDQANVIRKLIDDSFTPNNGVKVNLRLTGTDVLLKAALAGVGPNVAINVDSSLPVNYGLRGAVIDLKDEYSTENMDSKYSAYNYPDYETFIKENFQVSATSQFTFNNKAYALPEKQIFMMMFVNKKVMTNIFGEEWEEHVPNTWDEVINLVSDLQTESLQFYLPVNDSGATALNPVFVSMLYQMGGQLYINNNMETGLLEDEGMEAFKRWTDFYTLYSFPKFASFANRFRSGEMPIGLAYYELYNTLAVFAPEMRGNWAFYPIPGTPRTIYDEATGTNIDVIDHTSTASGTGCVILEPNVKNEEDAVKELAYSWEFLTWWTSRDIQARFGQEMEGILGSAARHATANIQAFQDLDWPKEDLDQLLKQWGVVTNNNSVIVDGRAMPYYVIDGVVNIYGVHEMPQIAGSYITGREVENAYRKVINNNINAKETLYEYAQNINNEINRKRKEFNLPTKGDD